ncbi:MAG: glycosyltransferase, partial [Planctomycetota bacterium]
SLAILRHFEASDERIRLVSRPNTGYVTALNEMLEMARGRFLARMDADDFAMPNRFSVQRSFLANNPQVSAVGSNVEFIDSRGRFLRLEQTAHHDEEIQDRLLRGECPICHPAVMMRAETVRKIGGYRTDREPAEDRDLWLRLGEIAELANIPQTLLKYRLHRDSVSETRRSDQVLNMRNTCEDAWERRGISGKFTAKTEIRPGLGRRSKFEFELKYGWWALKSGERRTSLSYARSAIAMMPWRPEGWQLLKAGLAPERFIQASSRRIEPDATSSLTRTSDAVARRPR